MSPLKTIAWIVVGAIISSFVTIIINATTDGQVEFFLHSVFYPKPQNPIEPIQPEPPIQESPKIPEPQIPKPTEPTVNEIINQEYNFGFSNASASLWVMKEIFEPELPTHPLIISNQTVTFQIITTNFADSRDKRIEIVIFEPNDWDVVTNIEQQGYVFNSQKFFSFQKNFSYKGHVKDIFYDQMPCDLIRNWEPCKRSGILDFYKEGDKLFIVHAWIDKSSNTVPSKTISEDILNIMDSFTILKE